MTNQIETNLFEELSDADLMAVVGGTLTKVVTDEGSNVVGFVDKSTNFDALGNAVGEIGGFVTAD